MKSFLAALVCTALITVVANIVLTETVPLASEQAYTSGPYVRVGAD
ncbi:hypothetical protein [Loktanella sp. SALINAS62]|nr:hypothetical protein [Loktanella sp. SALINAS62]MBS1303733.1 hypothetical protein [Loktanella sp. SALINAS62]